MPTPTYTPLANLTLSGSATSVTFSSISQSYRDLVLITVTTRDTAQDGAQQMQFNSDTASNYAIVRIAGNGSTASSSTSTTNGIADSLGFNTVFSSPAVTTWNVFDYSVTDKDTTVLVRANSNNGVGATAGRWTSTAAITSLRVFANNGSAYAAGSTFALYGIAS